MPHKKDVIQEYQGVTIIIDQESLEYVDDAIIDYKEGSGYKLRIPEERIKSATCELHDSRQDA